MNRLFLSKYLYVYLVILALSFGAFIITYHAHAISAHTTYGGKISYLTNSTTCVAPPSRLVKINPATEEGIHTGALSLVSSALGEQYMYLPIVTKAYGSTIGPKARGQNLLGWAGPGYVPCLVTCPTGLCPHFLGGGRPMLDIATGSI